MPSTNASLCAPWPKGARARTGTPSDRVRSSRTSSRVRPSRPGSHRSNPPKTIAGCPRQVPADEQGREHPVDPIRSLRHVLEREDGPCGKSEPARRGHGVHHRQVPAQQGPPRLPSVEDPEPAPHARRGRSLERREPRGANRGRGRDAEPRDVGPVHRRDSRPPGHGVERRDVAESDEPPRPSHELAPRHVVRDAKRSVPAARRDHGLRLRIGERPIELREAPRVAAGQVPVSLERPRRDANAIARSKPGEAAPEVARRKRARRRDDDDHVSRRERGRDRQRALHRCALEGSITPLNAGRVTSTMVGPALNSPIANRAPKSSRTARRRIARTRTNRPRHARGARPPVAAPGQGGRRGRRRARAAPRRAASPSAWRASRSSLGSSGVDPFGLDPEWMKYVILAVATLHRKYFRTEVNGIRSVPTGRVLFVANHSGQVPIDGALIAAALFMDVGAPAARARHGGEMGPQPAVRVSVLREGRASRRRPGERARACSRREKRSSSSPRACEASRRRSTSATS